MEEYNPERIAEIAEVTSYVVANARIVKTGGNVADRLGLRVSLSLYREKVPQEVRDILDKRLDFQALESLDK